MPTPVGTMVAPRIDEAAGKGKRAEKMRDHLFDGCRFGDDLIDAAVAFTGDVGGAQVGRHENDDDAFVGAGAVGTQELDQLEIVRHDDGVGMVVAHRLQGFLGGRGLRDLAEAGGMQLAGENLPPLQVRAVDDDNVSRGLLGIDEHGQPNLVSATNGLVRRSSPKVEVGPWPGMKVTSSPSGHSCSRIDLSSVS